MFESSHAIAPTPPAAIPAEAAVPAMRQASIAPVELADDGDSVSHSLAVLSTIYHYNHWVYDTIRPYLGPRVVEVGAGIGNITQFMLNAEKLVCVEPYEAYCGELRRRYQPHRNVSIVRCGVEQVPNGDVPAGQFDTVVCLNVLEHIADDTAALRRMGELLVPGGQVVIFVPALQCIYGSLDKAMGHVRRYNRPSLRAAFLAAGLVPSRGRYMNCVGMLGWWWTGRVLKHETIREGATRTFDRLVPYLSAMERIFPPLWGQSLTMVGTKS